MANSSALLKFSVAILMLAIPSTSPHAQNPGWTDDNRQADWGDGDYGCSPGRIPQSTYCTGDHIGHVAVCWDHPGCGGTVNGWCTYKNVNSSTTPNGASPGEVWICRSTSASNDVIVVPHEFHAWEQGGFALKTLK